MRRFLRQNLKACKVTTFTFSLQTVQACFGRKSWTKANPSLLELIFETMDRVSYWRQIHYHRKFGSVDITQYYETHTASVSKPGTINRVAANSTWHITDAQAPVEWNCMENTLHTSHFGSWSLNNLNIYLYLYIYIYIIICARCSYVVRDACVSVCVCTVSVFVCLWRECAPALLHPHPVVCCV